METICQPTEWCINNARGSEVDPIRKRQRKQRETTSTISQFPPFTHILGRLVVHQFQESTLHIQFPGNRLRGRHNTTKPTPVGKHMWLRRASKHALQIRPFDLELAHRRPIETEEAPSEVVLHGERGLVQFDRDRSNVGKVGLQLYQETPEGDGVPATGAVVPAHRSAGERYESSRLLESSWVVIERAVDAVAEPREVQRQRADEASDFLEIHILTDAVQCVELVEVLQVQSAVSEAEWQGFVHDLLVGKEEVKGVLAVQSLEEVGDGDASSFVEFVGLEYRSLFFGGYVFLVDLVA